MSFLLPSKYPTISCIYGSYERLNNLDKITKDSDDLNNQSVENTFGTGRLQICRAALRIIDFSIHCGGLIVEKGHCKYIHEI